MVADVMDRHVMSNGTLSAMVKSDGAELCSLRDTAGDEMLWQADAWFGFHMAEGYVSAVAPNGHGIRTV